MDELLTMLKKSRGMLDTDTSLDEYLKEFIDAAKADLGSDDISETILATDIGKQTIVLYAQKLIDNQDIATNPTLTYLRNKLSAMTKGEEGYANRN